METQVLQPTQHLAAIFVQPSTGGRNMDPSDAVDQTHPDGKPTEGQDPSKDSGTSPPEGTPKRKDFKQIATAAATRGIAVIPVPPGEKGCRLEDWPSRATTDPSQIDEWNQENPRYNCGAVAQPETVWFLDADAPDLKDQIERETGQAFPATYTVRTSRSFHYYFKQTPDSRQMGNVKVGGRFDCQVKNKYVIAAGSLHPSGALYAATDESALIVPAPKWLIDWLSRTADAGRKKIAQSNGDAKIIIEGGRNDYLTSQAGVMRRHGLERDAALAGLISENNQVCRPPLPEDEVHEIIRSVWRYPAGRAAAVGPEQEAPKNTDLGNAMRFEEAEGENVRYCFATKSWHFWDGTRWAKNEGDEIFRRARRVINELFCDALATEELAERQAIFKHALKSEALPRIEAMIKAARNLGRIPVKLGEFDKNPMLLNVLNGTIDLFTGQLQTHRREDLLCRLAPVRYEATARCPKWFEFLELVTDDNAEIMRYLQRCVGYSLTGRISERCLFLFQGPGKNGKSTFLTTLRLLLGEYARACDVNSFMANRINAAQARPDLVHILGARFVIANESDEDRRLAEGQIKTLTGGDALCVRNLYEGSFDVVPQFKLWLGTNHKPTIRGTDDAMWDRIKYIPFMVRIPEAKRVSDYGEKLFEWEASGILNWALEGLAEYLRVRLEEPAEVTRNVKDYRDSQDLVQSFIADRCLLEPGMRTQSLALYQAYKSWAEANGVPLRDIRSFRGELERRGHKSKQMNTGTIWLGVGLKREKTESPPNEEDCPF